MGFTVIIPARHGSTRLPGKMLLNLAGKPMVQHVYEKALASGAGRVVVATDHQDIVDSVNTFSGEVLLTSERHPSGTDRIAEAVDKLGFADNEIIVNVQGDEPQIDPEIINRVAQNLSDNEDASISTVAVPLRESQEFLNPNIVKVVLDNNNMALYFSRAPIPWPRDGFMGQEFSDLKLQELTGINQNFYRHIGIYAYTAGFVKEYVKIPQSDLEKTEALEQLRALSHGYRISVLLADNAGGSGVDTQDDYDRVKEIIERC